MAKDKLPTTQAIRELKRYGITFKLHRYRYREHGGTRVAAEELGVEEHCVVKTLVLEDQDKKPLVVLMHGDKEVSTKKLARAAGVKSIMPCEPVVARRHTGYQIGGISPFGMLKRIPVFVETTILELPTIYINAGRRGLLVEVPPEVLVRDLGATPVQAGR